ncbi:MAG: phosphotransferase family protein [Pseudomonadales bacterium]|jgi:aminoglycoside phosphotransferase (APT) family kinase protein|nr:phosphotransferase family protein [Pseudomonadales bacterium]
MAEGVDAERVTAWMGEHVEGIEPPLRFSLIAGGHSNLTYAVTDATGERWVLRRPPLGHVLESAHDVGREHRIISALAGTAVPVAPTAGLCRDVGVNDAPFYVMRFVEGTVLHDAEHARGLPEAERAALGEHVVEVLAALHAIDPEDVGLGDLGRKEAYLERQLKRWTKQWENSKQREIPAMEASRRLLAERMPEQIGASIVHGDYRLGNMMVGGGRIRAVLDWELCTLGDPLADVGYLLNSWIQPGELDTRQGDQAPTAVGGFGTRAALAERYAAATGRDLSQIDYYRAFSHWRLAAIGEGVYKRYLLGAMGERGEQDLTAFAESVVNRAEAALELLS